MAIIDLGPSRASRIGSSFGTGMSQGLLQRLLQEQQQQQKREQIRRQAEDMQNLSQALQGYQEGQQAPAGVGTPQGPLNLQQLMQAYQPQTEAGLGVMENLVKSRFQPPESYTLKPGEVRYQGSKPIATGLPEQKDQWSEPFKRGNDYVQKNLVTGKERKVHSVPETNVWSKPYKQGGQYMQRNKNTGEIKTLFAEDVGAQDLKAQRSINRAQSAIKTIMSKYDINPNLMQFTTTDESGNFKIDYQKFLEFQENPYRILEQKANTGDPVAIRDLQNVNKWINTITEVAGGMPVSRDIQDYNTDDPLGLFQ